jgi:transposase
MTTHHHPNRALSQKDMEARRLTAVPYFKKHWSERQIAGQLDVSSVAVHQWKVLWKTKGVPGLKAGVYGNPSRLPARKEREVQKKIMDGAEHHGFSGDFWTLSRLTSAIFAWTGVRYHDRSVWHVLKRLGFSCQKPAKKARERDEKAITTWLSVDWPEVKKGALKNA